MTKLVVLLAALVLVVGFAATAEAQDPPPDLGETNLLLLACSLLTQEAARQEVEVVNCRRSAAEQVDGSRAVVFVRAKTNFGVRLVQYEFRKSLWWLEKWEVVS